MPGPASDSYQGPKNGTPVVPWWHSGGYRIESRTSAAFRWRIVGPKPHGESYPFDQDGLIFSTYADAHVACEAMRNSNAAEFRIRVS